MVSKMSSMNRIRNKLASWIRIGKNIYGSTTLIMGQDTIILYDAGMPLAYASMKELLQQAVDHSFT